MKHRWPSLSAQTTAQFAVPLNLHFVPQHPATVGVSFVQ